MGRHTGYSHGSTNNTSSKLHNATSLNAIRTFSLWMMGAENHFDMYGTYILLKNTPFSSSRCPLRSLEKSTTTQRYKTSTSTTSYNEPNLFIRITAILIPIIPIPLSLFLIGSLQPRGGHELFVFGLGCCGDKVLANMAGEYN